MKKIVAAIMVYALVLCFPGLVMAADEKKPEEASALTADDIKWIAKCIEDNKDQGQPAEVVKKYCECMNSKMDANESQSVTQWEKTHPKERKECDAVSGWK
jgi:invasion protein IalB